MSSGDLIKQKMMIDEVCRATEKLEIVKSEKRKSKKPKKGEIVEMDNEHLEKSDKDIRTELSECGQILIIGIASLAHLIQSLNDVVDTKIIDMPIIDWLRLHKNKMLQDILEVVDLSKNLTIIFDSAESLLSVTPCIKLFKHNGTLRFIKTSLKQKVKYVMKELHHRIEQNNSTLNNNRKEKIPKPTLFATFYFTYRKIVCCKSHGIVKNDYSLFLKNMNKKTIQNSNDSRNIKGLMEYIYNLLNGDILSHRYYLREYYNLGVQKTHLRFCKESFDMKIKQFDQEIRSDSTFVKGKQCRYVNKSSKRFYLNRDSAIFSKFDEKYKLKTGQLEGKIELKNITMTNIQVPEQKIEAALIIRNDH